jgi:SAM-dependent methyltransferase
VGDGFDAILCLGNSLPHLDPAAVAAALAGMARCLRPGGLLLIQNRNFDRVLDQGDRWMDPQAHREGESEWVFGRWYDFEKDGTITFNLMTLARRGGSPWHQHHAATLLWPLRQAELIESLAGAGFDAITCYGDMAGAPFDPAASGNLVVTARS